MCVCVCDNNASGDGDNAIFTLSITLSHPVHPLGEEHDAEVVIEWW